MKALLAAALLMPIFAQAMPMTNPGSGSPLVQKTLFGLFEGRAPQPQYAPGGTGGLYEEDDGPAAPTTPSSQVRVPVAPPEPQIVFDYDSMKNLEDWKVKYFDVVVVINKAVSGQNVYVFQKSRDGELPVLVLGGEKISTGRETPEYSNPDRRALGREESDHAPSETYFSNTPQGYYTPTSLDIAYVSNQWEAAAMDYAVFFQSRRGIATHRAPTGTEKDLGKPASGACVRMSREVAREIFWMVRATGGPITAAELAPDNKVRAVPGPSFSKEYEKRYKAGLRAYEGKPMIPAFTREGVVKRDATGEIVMREAGFRTLIVVENRPLARR